LEVARKSRRLISTFESRIGRMSKKWCRMENWTAPRKDSES